MSGFVWLMVAVTLLLVGKRILAQVDLWQRKEYRWDRLRALLLSREAIALFPPLLVAAAVTWIVAVFSITTLSSATTAIAVISTLFLISHEGKRVIAFGVHRPKFTVKAISVGMVALLGTSAAVWLLSMVMSNPVLIAATAALVVVPLAVAVGVPLVNIPFYWRKRLIITRATHHRRRLSALRVLGITGSYGKTSAKHFLAQLLQRHAGVVATREHRNTEIGVAVDMLEQVTPATKIYVTEMGAYRRGEIAALVRLAQPQLGLITAIGTQHIALFGSQQAIMEAKWELIAGLPSSGIAILNRDDLLLRNHAAKAACKIIWYSSHSVDDVEVGVHDIVIAARSITATMRIADHEQRVTIPLASQTLLSSAMAAVAAAHGLGVAAEEIFQQVPHLVAFPRTMEVYTTPQGTTVIDDSYSANDVGVVHAIEHMKLFTEANKIIVLRPLIELGQHAAAAHERIGAALADSQATVYVTGPAYADSLRRGAQAVRPDFTLTVIEQADRLVDRLRSLPPSTAVLLEGRVPDIVRHHIRTV